MGEDFAKGLTFTDASTAEALYGRNHPQAKVMNTSDIMMRETIVPISWDGPTSSATTYLPIGLSGPQLGP